MKYILILGFLTTIFGTKLSAQTENNSLKPIKKMVKEISYRVQDGKLKKRKDLFNSNISSYMVYDKNEKIIETGKYERDGSIYEKVFYERNENGKAIKALKKNSENEIKSYWTYEYDSNQNAIEVNTYNSENILTKIQSNKYDENGNNIEMILKAPESENGWKYVYKYNSDNKKIEQFRYKPDGSIKDRRTYNYNNDGNEFEQFQHKPDGTIMKYVSEYDEMDNLINHTWYDEQGNQTHQTSYEYVYDENGNWITKKSSSKGVLSMVYERQIEYH